LNTLLRYVHTLRHLRPTQLLVRIYFGLQSPRPDTRAAPAVRAVSGAYVPPVEAVPSLVAADVFRFLNVQRRCHTAADWQAADAARLWTYNLHYFDDLNAHASATRVQWHHALLERWVRENPPGVGTGWEPYPLSRRIVNWVKWSLRGNALPAACRTSLAVQARWLLGRLEYHLLANHLFSNAVALVHAGRYFTGPEAARWCERGLQIIARQLPEQVLSDGGHFERSPMYHASALAELLDLVNLLHAYGEPAPVAWDAVIARMRTWLQIMSHPDGEIAFFNDAAMAVAPNHAQLELYAGRLGLPALADPRDALAVLESSGYVRAVVGEAYMLCDVAPLGPHYQPGHAHADTLSFELSLRGRRVLVNSGTSSYETGAERHRQRGTAAHNTVVVNGADSSEVWAAFRVARRACAQLHGAHSVPSEIVIEGSHDGYRRLPGRNEHRRQWCLDERSLSIEDRVSGRFRTAEARFHLHPQVTAQLSGASAVMLTCGDGLGARLAFEGAASVELSGSSWHPGFGLAQASCCVVARFGGDTLRTRLVWAQPP
jgi:uncharacterized heparinase superfamily protein